jgi:L-idonate 5-dehydrogenase
MNDTMQAGVLYGAKDIRVERRQRPVLQAGMVLIHVRRVGICGSDLHYFDEGRCGGFVPTRPFVLGHELSGEIAEVADGVSRLVPGLRVTVNPARACGSCEYCRSGRGNLCPSTIMLGSASTNPPTDGAMADYVAVRADQCHVLPAGMDEGLGAMMEPFAVALHAVKQAGSISGRRVLVTGGGPIGLLVAITAKAFGAAPVVLSDVVDDRRRTALALAADAVLDPAAKDLSDQVRELTGDGFDAVFEASGASLALRQAFNLVRPGGTIVQIGTLTTDDIPLPANQVMAREIRFVGSFRYGDVFDEAIRLAARGRVNLQPLISCVLPLPSLGEAMRRALARDNTMKVQLTIP